MEKQELIPLLYHFLDAIYCFERKEEGLFGAVWQDIHLLKQLSRGGALSVSQVAEFLKVELFEASRLVSRMEHKGWVSKDRLPDNRRVVAVSLAPGGQDLLDRTEEFHYQTISRNLGVLDAVELRSIQQAIGKLRTLLELDA